MLLVAVSGMITGGRIVHHLKTFGTDPENALLLVPIRAERVRIAADAFRRHLRDRLGWEAHIPRHGERVEIE